MTTTHSVYWIHTTKQTNPSTEGYIGVTTDVKRRWKEHQFTATTNSKLHLYNAMRKYASDLVYEVLEEGLAKQTAYDLELFYRPETNIGWNMAIGGEGIANTTSIPITIYHKSNYLKVYTYPSVAEAVRQNPTLTEGSLSAMRSRSSKLYNREGWAILWSPEQDRSTTITVEHNRSIYMKNRNRGPSHFKGSTNRWSNEQKAVIGAFHKGKTISKQQRETVRQKNRISNPQCKEITLYHTDLPNVLHTFHSVSEASRELGISLSGLKSVCLRKVQQYSKTGWAVVQNPEFDRSTTPYSKYYKHK